MTSFYTLILLTFSNLFMTFAWYGHLKYKSAPIITVILVSWGIAFFEYVLQVPANRMGSSIFSLSELKTIQEVISIAVFVIVATTYFGEPLKWNYIVGLGLIALGAGVVFYK